MMEQFFRNLLEDETRSEQVKPHLKKAYEECLLPYHGFLAQKAFQVSSAVPHISDSFSCFTELGHKRKKRIVFQLVSASNLWPFN